LPNDPKGKTINANCIN